MNRRFGLALAAYAASFALGAAVLHGVLHAAPPAVARDLAQPLPVVTAWGAFGARCFGVLAAVIAAAAAALAVAVRNAPAVLRRPWVPVAATAAAELLGAAAWPCTFSSDPYAYAAYGAEAARGLDPYLPVAAGVHGASIDAARYQWGGAFPACVYGPFFVRFAETLWRLTARFGPGTPIAALRLTAGLAFLASIPLVDAALDGLAPRRRIGLVCAYGLQPVAVWSVAEGHNDAYVLLIAAAALLVARRGYPFSAGVLLGISAAAKAPGAFFAAAFALHALAIRRRVAGALGAAGGLVLAGLIAIPPLLPALGAARAHGTYLPQGSLQALTGPVPALVLAALAAAFGAARIGRGTTDGFAWLGLAATAALPNVYPWYALWLVPIALAAGPGPAATALYGVTICAVLRYLPDAAGNMTSDANRVASAAALLPLAVLCTGIAPFVRRKKVVAPS